MAEDVGQLSREIGLALPAQAHVLGVRRMNGMDDATFVKIEMTPEEWEKVLSTAPFAERDLTAESRGYLEPDDGWWDPSTHPKLRAVQVVLPGVRALNVGVDESQRPRTIILYVMNHGT